MRISILLCNGNEPLPKQGGMERVTDALAKGLLSKGISVILLCKRLNRLGEIYDSPCPIYFVPDSGERDFIREILIKYKITHLIDQAEGEIIGPYGYFKTREPCFNHIKLIAVQHSSPKSIMDNYEIAMLPGGLNALSGYIYRNLILKIRKIHSERIIRRLHQELNKNYDRIVVLSPSFIDDFMFYNPKADRTKLRAIANMNTYENVKCSRRQKSVLFVGRLISNKGCDKLLRIWKLAGDGLSAWTLDIVGDGPDRNMLVEYAKSLGLQRCTFHGFQTPTSYYQKASIFCLTSIFEGFGMVLTEAMQHGVVPIAFHSYKAIDDIIVSGKDGIIIQPFDEHEYAAKLRKLMTDDALRNKMSDVAMESVKKFSSENIINQWIQLLNEK